MHLAQGLEKPRSATETTAANGQLAVLSGPGGILFSSCHPVANICLSLVPLTQAPCQPGAVGTRRDALTATQLSSSTDMPTDTLTDTDTHGGTPVTRARDPRGIHVYSLFHKHTHKRTCHTSQCPVTGSGAHAGGKMSSPWPTLSSRETTCKQPRKCFLPQICV